MSDLDEKEKNVGQSHFDDLISRNYKPGEEDQTEAAARDGAAKDKSERNGLYNPNDGDDKKASKEELSNKESAAAGAKKEPDTSYRGMRKHLKELSSKVKKNKKKAGIIALVGGGSAGLIMGGFFMLGPLKLVSTMTNLQNEFFAASDNASSKMSDQMVNHYLIRKVIPGMAANPGAGCTSTRADRSCAAVSDSASPVGALFMAWRDANLEGKLAQNHGIEIRKGAAGSYYLRAPGLNTDLDLGTYDGATRTFSGDPYAKLNRTDVRRIIKASFEAETLSKQLRYKHNVGKLMERKYGIRRCIVACQTKDKVQDWGDSKRNALKLFMTERVIMPHSEMMALALTCAMSNFDCADPGSPDNDGERQSKFQREVRASLVEYQRIHGTRPMADLEAEAERVRQYGMTGYMVRRIAGDTVGAVAGKLTSRAIPILGWVDGLSAAFETAKNAGGAIKHLNYVVNTMRAASLAGMLLTNADEQKTGMVDAEVQGSMASVFDEVPGGDQGGGAMEATPIYDNLMNGTAGQTQPASVFDLFSPRVYAAESESEEEVTAFTCEDGNLVPAGEMVCPIMSFGVFSTITQSIGTLSNAANSDLAAPIAVASTIWRNTGGLFFDALGWVIGTITSAAANVFVPEDIQEQMVAWIKENFMGKVVMDQMGDNPSGGRMFEIVTLGMFDMGNTDAHLNQGGAVLAQEDVEAIKLQQAYDREAEFEGKPLYARLFDKNDSYSMVSRIAVSMPSSSVGLQSRMSSFLSSPLDTISSSFSAIFTTQKVKAFPITQNIFGLPTMGYAPDHEVFQPGFDPEAYWENNNCDDPELKIKWGEKATEIDPNTNVALQKTTEPCMLIRDTISAGGGIFNTALLTPVPGGASGTPGSATPPGEINMGEVFQPSDTMTCPAGTDGGVQDGYNEGTLVKIRVCNVQGTVVNARIAAIIDAVLNKARSEGLNLSGGGFRTMETQRNMNRTNPSMTAAPGYSNHQMGLAVDFSLDGRLITTESNPGFRWMDANRSLHGLEWLRSPYEPWHWSVDGT